MRSVPKNLLQSARKRCRLDDSHADVPSASKPERLPIYAGTSQRTGSWMVISSGKSPCDTQNEDPAAGTGSCGQAPQEPLVDRGFCALAPLTSCTAKLERVSCSLKELLFAHKSPARSADDLPKQRCIDIKHRPDPGFSKQVKICWPPSLSSEVLQAAICNHQLFLRLLERFKRIRDQLFGRLYCED